MQFYLYFYLYFSFSLFLYLFPFLSSIPSRSLSVIYRHATGILTMFIVCVFFFSFYIYNFIIFIQREEQILCVLMCKCMYVCMYECVCMRMRVYIYSIFILLPFLSFSLFVIEHLETLKY